MVHSIGEGFQSRIIEIVANGEKKDGYLDDYTSDHDITPEFTCEIELELSGSNDATLTKWCADALRRIADRIGREELASGRYEVPNNIGKKMGTFDLEYTGYAE